VDRRRLLARTETAPGRRGPRELITGPSIEKSIAPLRSFITEPMRFGRMFLAGDAASHRAAHRRQGAEPGGHRREVPGQWHHRVLPGPERAGIDSYSEKCLKRIWKAERFSWWFTQLMHRFPDDGAIVSKFQLAELDYLIHSEAGSRTIAENYVGLPLDFGQTRTTP
jgi:p-hydroxybenzoate 3-monooxygenase